MNNIAFVMWLVGWPIAESISSYLLYKRGFSCDGQCFKIAFWCSLATWLIVAALLFEVQ